MKHQNGAIIPLLTIIQIPFNCVVNPKEMTDQWWQFLFTNTVSVDPLQFVNGFTHEILDPFRNIFQGSF